MKIAPYPRFEPTIRASAELAKTEQNGGYLILDWVAESECSVLVGPGERNALEQKSNREGARLAAFHNGLSGRSSSAFLAGPC
jgi:hypothetical protein